jgi:hypothetical protein
LLDVKPGADLPATAAIDAPVDGGAWAHAARRALASTTAGQRRSRTSDAPEGDGEGHARRSTDTLGIHILSRFALVIHANSRDVPVVLNKLDVVHGETKESPPSERVSPTRSRSLAMTPRAHSQRSVIRAASLVATRAFVFSKPYTLRALRACHATWIDDTASDTIHHERLQRHASTVERRCTFVGAVGPRSSSALDL